MLMKASNLRDRLNNEPSMRIFIFYIILLGQCVSYIGSGVMCFAQAVWVYTDLGGTITQLTLIAVTARLPGILISPLAGAIADRFDRRIIMIISDSVAALATLSLRVLIVTQNFSLWHIYVIVTIISIANRFQWPAYVSSVPQLVPKNHLGRANGMISVSQSIGLILSPVFAGFLVTMFKIEGVILFDMATFLFAFVTLLFVRFPKTQKTIIEKNNEAIKLKKSIMTDMHEGWKYLIGKKAVLGLILFMAVGSFASGIASPLYLPMILGVVDAKASGVIFSVGGIGALLGGLFMSIWGGPRRKIFGVYIFMFSFGIGIIIGGINTWLPLFFISMFFYHFSTPIREACSNVIIQKQIPNHIQGRVFAITLMISSIALHLGNLTAGPLADFLFEPAMAINGRLSKSFGLVIGVGKGRGIALIFIILGVLCTISTIIAYLNKRIRYVELDEPDTDKGNKESLLLEKEYELENI